MTKRARLGYAIGKRRWWLGGGFDVIEGTLGAKNLFDCWPITLAWFRERRHAELFAAMMQGRTHGEQPHSTKDVA